MQKILLALIAISAAGTIDAAVAQNYPYCLRGCDFGAGYCSFSTLQQCQASAAGRDAWCDANPFYQQTRDRPPARYSRRRF